MGRSRLSGPVETRICPAGVTGFSRERGCLMMRGALSRHDEGKNRGPSTTPCPSSSRVPAFSPSSAVPPAAGEVAGRACAPVYSAGCRWPAVARCAYPAEVAGQFLVLALPQGLPPAVRPGHPHPPPFRQVRQFGRLRFARVGRRVRPRIPPGRVDQPRPHRLSMWPRPAEARSRRGGLPAGRNSVFFVKYWTYPLFRSPPISPESPKGTTQR